VFERRAQDEGPAALRVGQFEDVASTGEAVRSVEDL
jgi:hypothetical protein